VAASNPFLYRYRKPLGAQTSAGISYLLGRGDLNTQVIEGPGLTRILEEDELEGRVGDRKIGIAGTPLGGVGREEFGIEINRFIEVADVESELHPAHIHLLSINVD
jgi:hypothetical protein